MTTYYQLDPNIKDFKKKLLKTLSKINIINLLKTNNKGERLKLINSC